MTVSSAEVGNGHLFCPREVKLRSPPSAWCLRNSIGSIRPPTLNKPFARKATPFTSRASKVIQNGYLECAIGFEVVSIGHCDLFWLFCLVFLGKQKTVTGSAKTCHSLTVSRFPKGRTYFCESRLTYSEID